MTPEVSDEVKDGYDILEGIGIIERTEDGLYYPTDVGAAVIWAVLCKQMLEVSEDDFGTDDGILELMNRLEEMDLVEQNDESFVITLEGFSYFFANLAYDCPYREEFIDWLALATAELAEDME